MDARGACIMWPGVTANPSPTSLSGRAVMWLVSVVDRGGREVRLRWRGQLAGASLWISRRASAFGPYQPYTSLVCCHPVAANYGCCTYRAAAGGYIYISVTCSVWSLFCQRSSRSSDFWLLNWRQTSWSSPWELKAHGHNPIYIAVSVTVDRCCVILLRTV